MYILHMDTGEKMQGGQWQVLYLMRGLRERGHQQVLLARGKLAHRAATEGFDVRRLGMSLPAAEVIHAHDAKAHMSAAIRARVPVVVSRRVAFPIGRGLLSRWKYRRGAHYVAVSRHVADGMIASGIKPHRISVVYDGVPLRQPREQAAAGQILGLGKQSMERILRRAAKAAGVAIRMAVDIPKELLEASALAYITRVEGLGSAALLAMSSGVPVIASRTGGLPEIVKDGVSGLLVDNTIPSIAEALGRIAADAAFRAELAQNGYDRVRTEFTLDRMVGQTEEIYRMVLA